jgi:DNA modification methylase
VKPYFQNDMVVIYHGDCREIVPNLSRFDLLLTDPPYGRAGEEPFAVTEAVLSLDQWETAAVILDWRNPIRGPRKVGEVVWQYGWVSGFRAKAKTGVCHTHNTVHLLGDAKRMRFTDGSIVLRQPGFSSPRHCSFAVKSGHPYEKPVPFLRWILQRIDADTVLDPFCGSGSTGVACIYEGRRCVMVDVDAGNCEKSAQRVRAALAAHPAETKEEGRE